MSRPQKLQRAQGRQILQYTNATFVPPTFGPEASAKLAASQESWGGRLLSADVSSSRAAPLLSKETWLGPLHRHGFAWDSRPPCVDQFHAPPLERSTISTEIMMAQRTTACQSFENGEWTWNSMCPGSRLHIVKEHLNTADHRSYSDNGLRFRKSMHEGLDPKSAELPHLLASKATNYLDAEWSCVAQTPHSATNTSLLQVPRIRCTPSPSTGSSPLSLWQAQLPAHDGASYFKTFAKQHGSAMAWNLASQQPTGFCQGQQGCARVAGVQIMASGKPPSIADSLSPSVVNSVSSQPDVVVPGQKRLSRKARHQKYLKCRAQCRAQLIASPNPDLVSSILAGVKAVGYNLRQAVKDVDVTGSIQQERMVLPGHGEHISVLSLSTIAETASRDEQLPSIDAEWQSFITGLGCPIYSSASGCVNHLPENLDSYQTHYGVEAKVYSSTGFMKKCVVAGQEEAAEPTESPQIMEAALKSLSSVQSVASWAVVEARESVEFAMEYACEIVETERLQLCEALKEVKFNALTEIQNECFNMTSKQMVVVEALGSAQANVKSLQGKSDTFSSNSQIAAWEMKKTALSNGHKASLGFVSAAAEKTQKQIMIATQQAGEARNAIYKSLIETSEHGVSTLQKKCDTALLYMQTIGESMMHSSRPKDQCAKTWERKVIMMAQSIVKKAISALKKTALAAHELTGDSVLFRGSGLEGLLSSVELETDEWEAWVVHLDVLLQQKEDASGIACGETKVQLDLRDAAAEVQSIGSLAISKLQTTFKEHDSAHMAELEACRMEMECKYKANMALLFAREEAEQASLEMLASAEKFCDNEEMNWKDAVEKTEKDLYETALKASTDLLCRLDVRFLAITDQATLACKEAEDALKAAQLKEAAVQVALRTAQEGWKTLDEAVKKAVVLAESCVHNAQRIGQLAAEEAQDTMSRLKSTFLRTVREDAEGWERRAMMLFKAPLNSARRAAEKASTEAERLCVDYAVSAFTGGGQQAAREFLCNVLSAAREAAEWAAQFAGEKRELLKLAGCKAACGSMEQGQKLLDAVEVQAAIRSAVTKLEAMLNAKTVAQNKDQEVAKITYMTSRVALAEAELHKAIDCPRMTAAGRRAAGRVITRLAPDFFAPLVQAREDCRGDPDDVLGPHDICCKYCFDTYVMDLDHDSCPVLAPCCGARLCKACAVKCASSSNPSCVNRRTGCRVEESKPSFSDYVADKDLVLRWKAAFSLGYEFSGE